MTVVSAWLVEWSLVAIIGNYDLACDFVLSRNLCPSLSKQVESRSR